MFRLDQFFRVCDDDVKMPDGKSITMRVLSDIEMNGRQSYSLAKMTEVTKELRSPESDLYQQKIAPLAEASRDSLVDTVVQSRRWELIREANELFRYDILPYPENATELEKIEVETNQDKHETNVAETRLKYVVDNEKAFRDRLESLDLDVLIKTAQERAIQSYAISSGIDAETYYTLWCACEVADKHYFASPDSVAKLNPKVITFLAKTYKGLDSIDPWELTKSV